MSDKSTLRRNITTGRWVIYAPSRGHRPHDFAKEDKKKRALPSRDQNCPFCPGNEKALLSVLYQMPSDDPPGWKTRVVPNKFPALTVDGNPERKSDGIYLYMEGHGEHEVIIESPRHDIDIAAMSPQEALAVVKTYSSRYRHLRSFHKNMMIILFRNHGPTAGTSLIHPHSQIIVTGFVPQHIRLREVIAQRHYDTWGRCLYCDIMRQETSDGRRLVAENDHFLTFVPFAAEVPFEMWIMPKAHQADFGDVSEEEEESLSVALQNALRSLREKLGDPDYNFVINSSPQYRGGEPHLHWHLRIMPRLTTPAGFEIGSGVTINPSLPEVDAAFLRA
ncbi:MAG TPA: galactose-1-phosphate uridylyltransferase [Synergistaceae bacterium]|nr:galactose-1-phosphate uridylyltransferase [Synergistaceae bacterium]